MKKQEETPLHHATWWLWNGRTFERHDLQVERMEFSKCLRYRFYRVQNPVQDAPADRHWLIAEGGSGYVLAYGADAQDALRTALERFRFERENLRDVDVMQYVRAHLDLLRRFVGDQPDFVLPAPGLVLRPVHPPAVPPD